MTYGRQPQIDKDIDWVIDEDNNVLGYMKDQATLMPIGGSSVTIVNDLTTGGADKALAAEQGVVLNGKLRLSASVGDLSHMTGSVGSRTLSAAVESASITAGNSKTLLDTTATPGPGCVDALFVISDIAAGIRDATLDIYIDGASTPIQIQLQALGTFLQGNTTKYQVDHLTVTAGSSDGSSATLQNSVLFKYPIPYQTSIKIVYNCALLAVTARCWANITYRSGVSYPFSFQYSGLTYQNRLLQVSIANQANRTVKFLDLPSGANNKGFIAGFGLFGRNATNQSWLENNIVAYQGTQLRDGTVTPAFNTSGGEDFFDGCFYFNLGVNSYRDVFVSNLTTTSAGMHKDLISAYGGLWFDDGVLLTMEAGLTPGPVASSTAVDIFYGVIWYKAL